MQTPNYAVTPTVNAATLSIGDISRTAPVNASTIFTPPAAAGTSPAGAAVERISVNPLGTISATVLRLFRYDVANTAYHLYAEIAIPALTAANGTANAAAQGAAALTLQAVDYPTLFPIAVPANWQLRATINDSQIAQEMALNSIAQAQTTGGAALLNLNGTNVTAASATAVAAAAAPTINVPMTLTSTPYVAANPALVSLTSAANVSAVSYKIVGRDAHGALISEVLVGPNANTVFSTKAYKSVLMVIPNASNAGTVSVGYSTVAGLTILPLPSPIILAAGANLSAINFTITGTTPDGLVQTEVLAGPNAGTAQSVNTYASVLTIAASAAVGSNVTAGVPAILSGLKVQAEGGGY